MKETTDTSLQLNYTERKQLCLYLFKQGIGYRRASKLLGIKLYTSKDYYRQYSQGIYAFAGWKMYEPHDPNLLKIVTKMAQLKSYSIKEICEICDVRYEDILVYSYCYEKEQRDHRGRYHERIEFRSDSAASFSQEEVRMGIASERDSHGKPTRLDERSGDWPEVQGDVKKKRVDKVNSLIKKGVPVAKACAASNLPRSNYYRHKTKSRKQASDEMLAMLIKNLQENPIVKYSYGIDRMTAEINRCIETMESNVTTLILNGSKKINHKRIERIMKEYGLNAKIKRERMPKNYYKAQKESVERNKAPNILKRNFFDVKEPGKVLVTDVTYLPCLEGGFIYLSAILDLATQEIVSYVISSENSSKMVTRTLRNIIGKTASKCIVHSDQGAVYKSDDWIVCCNELGVQRSMSRKGNCWDNAVMENFFSRLKSDLCLTKQQMKDLLSKRELREIVCAYIHWYNNERIQKRLGYLPPSAYRKSIESHTLLTSNAENDIMNTPLITIES